MEETNMNAEGFLQRIYDDISKSNHHEFFDRFDEYEACVNEYREQAISNNWEEIVFRKLVKDATGQGISNLSRRIFSWEEFESIKNNWHDIQPLFKEIAEKSDITLHQYQEIVSFFRKQTKGNKPAATNRVIAAFLPNIVTTLVAQDRFNFVIKRLKKQLSDYPDQTGGWLQDNKNFVNYCNSNINFKHLWHSSLFAWHLYRYFEDQEDINQKKIEKMKEYIKLLTANKNLILTGAPGTGKTYLANQIAMEMIKGQTTDSTKNEYIDFVQFHPSYDYTDFVEGLRPKKEKGEKEIGFGLEDGVFKYFCRKAKDNAKDKYVFIIDEINRGEISKIFGELFFLIDPEYRGEKWGVKTHYSNMHDDKNEMFYVPDNVYIIGTMNDIDRSMESMDFAIRRRFAWKEITAEESQRMLDNEDTWESHKVKKPDEKIIEEMKQRMNHLNNAIIDEKIGLSPAYQIGAAYFLKYALYADEPNPFDSLWKYHLKGVLVEYLRGDSDPQKKETLLKEAYELKMIYGKNKG